MAHGSPAPTQLPPINTLFNGLPNPHMQRASTSNDGRNSFYDPGQSGSDSHRSSMVQPAFGRPRLGASLQRIASNINNYHRPSTLLIDNSSPSQQPSNQRTTLAPNPPSQNAGPSNHLFQESEAQQCMRKARAIRRAAATAAFSAAQPIPRRPITTRGKNLRKLLPSNIDLAAASSPAPTIMSAPLQRSSDALQPGNLLPPFLKSAPLQRSTNAPPAGFSSPPLNRGSQQPLTSLPQPRPSLPLISVDRKRPKNAPPPSFSSRSFNLGSQQPLTAPTPGALSGNSTTSRPKGLELPQGHLSSH